MPTESVTISSMTTRWRRTPADAATSLTVELDGVPLVLTVAQGQSREEAAHEFCDVHGIVGALQNHGHLGVHGHLRHATTQVRDGARLVEAPEFP